MIIYILISIIFHIIVLLVMQRQIPEPINQHDGMPTPKQMFNAACVIISVIAGSIFCLIALLIN